MTDVFFYLAPEDNALIFLRNGQFFGIMGCTQEEINQNMDLITSEMNKSLQDAGCSTGYWVFKIKKDWTVISGQEIPVLEDDRFNTELWDDEEEE